MSGYPTRYTAEGCDSQCVYRSCMWPGEDKGILAQGRGYTRYHKKPLPVCMQRHLHGCPYLKPKPDVENARCCYAPNYKRKGKAPSGWRTCETCGTMVPLQVAKALNNLPKRDGVPCLHEQVEPSIITGWFECPSCRYKHKGVFDHRPLPFEKPNKTLQELYDTLEVRLNQTAESEMTLEGGSAGSSPRPTE